MLLRYRLRFAGKSGAEAEDFVDWVRQRALDLGKLDDVHWTAKFASGCFVGSALRWYISLESGVQDDWVALQRALFAQYGQEFEEGSSIIPVPAPPTAAPVTAATAHIASNGRHRGRIKVFMEGDSVTYYLSKDASQHSGRLYATATVADALEVAYESLSASDGPQSLLIPDNQIPGFDELGLKWDTADRTADTNWLGISGVNSTSGAACLDQGLKGTTLPRPWRVAQSEDHQISISALDTSGSGERLTFLSDCEGHRWVWFRLQKLPGEKDSKLLFEPI